MTILLRRRFWLIKADPQINYTYDDIRKWLDHFRTLGYTKTKNRKALIDAFIYRVVLYDDKMKVLFNLKSGQKNELLLNLIFPDYPDFGGGSGSGNEGEKNAKEKETENSVSQSGCSYTPVMVHPSGLEPEPRASEALMVSNSTTGA